MPEEIQLVDHRKKKHTTSYGMFFVAGLHLFGGPYVVEAFQMMYSLIGVDVWAHPVVILGRNPFQLSNDRQPVKDHVDVLRLKVERSRWSIHMLLI